MSFSACDVLLNLIPALQVDIFVRWLHLNDVVKLDSALCSSRLREIFFMILREEYCVFDNSSSKLYNKLLPWVIHRKVKVTTVDLTQEFSNAHRATLFRIIGKNLRTLITSVRNFNPLNTAITISAKWQNLEKLVFSGYDLLKEDICSVLMHLPRLQHLDLSYCSNLTGEMLRHINIHGKNLITVDLSICKLSAPATLVLAENHSIRTLTMIGCQEIEMCIPFVLQCKALKTLYVNNLTLADVFAILTRCQALTTLSAGIKMDQSQTISETELNTLISLISNLEVLHFYHSYSHHWREGQLERLLKDSPKLHTLFAAHLHGHMSIPETIDHSIAEVHRFGGNGKPVNDTQHQLHTLFIDDMVSSELQNILQFCPRLVSLSIRNVGQLNDEDALHNLMATIGNSSIRIFEVSTCDHLSSSAALQLRNLVSVSFNRFVPLKHHELVEFLSHHPALRRLSLIDCQNLHHKSLLTIIEKCTTLEELAFDNTCDSFMDTMLVKGLIKLLRPCLKLSMQLHPE